MTAVCRGAEDVIRLVLRHHHVRISGAPLLTVVAGAPRVVARLMNDVDVELARETVEFGSAVALVASWAVRIARSARVRERLAAVAGDGGRAPHERTAFDWRKLVAGLTGHDGDAPAEIAQSIARGDGAGLARLLAPEQRLDPVALQCLSRLIGGRALPGLRAVVRSADGFGAATDGLLGFLEVPALATELIAPWEAVESWLDGGASRARALVREGLVRVPAAGLGRPRDARGSYRSWPERLLHEMLQADPDTGGLFTPNARLAVRFGGRVAEVDLLCSQLRIAVEVDGWHHFRGAEHRRDRRRDLVLQQQGYLVVRVLAEDITDNPAAVAAQIREVVCVRQRSGQQLGGSA